MGQRHGGGVEPVLIVIPVVDADSPSGAMRAFGICNNPVPPKLIATNPADPGRLILQHDRHWDGNGQAA